MNHGSKPIISGTMVDTPRRRLLQQLAGLAATPLSLPLLSMLGGCGGGSTTTQTPAQTASLLQAAVYLGSKKAKGYDRRLLAPLKSPPVWAPGQYPRQGQIVASRDGQRWYICAHATGAATVTEPSGTNAGVIPDSGTTGPAWFYFGKAVASTDDDNSFCSLIPPSNTKPALFDTGRDIVDWTAAATQKYWANTAGLFTPLYGEKNFSIASVISGAPTWIATGDQVNYKIITDSFFIGFNYPSDGAQVLIDGIPLYPGVVANGNGSVVADSYRYWGVQFTGPRKFHEIIIEAGYMGEIWVDAQATITPPSAPGAPFKWLSWGDSWTGGVNGMTPTSWDSINGVLAQALGIGPTMPMNSAGGTGVVNGGPGGVANYADRFKFNVDRGYFTADNPLDLNFIQSSVNDGGATPDAIDAGYLNLLTKIYSLWPNTLTLVTGIMLGLDGNTNVPAANAAIVSAIKKFNNPLVKYIGGGAGGGGATDGALINSVNGSDNIADLSSNFFIGVPKGYSSLYPEGNGHPIFAGNYWMGRNLADLVWRALGIA